MEFFNSAKELLRSEWSKKETDPDEIAAEAARNVRTVPKHSIDKLPAGVTIVCISDTHQRLDKMQDIPDADVLIHGGDFSDTGGLTGVKGFVDWMDGLPQRQKIFIAGNHDTTLHSEYYIKTGAERFHPNALRRENMDPASYAAVCREAVQTTRTCTYLEDSSTEIVGGLIDRVPSPIVVYGSPWQPEFGDWAFNLDRGPPCAEKWSEIPLGTDVLITHGPPYGFGDRTVSGFRCGCEDMISILKSRETKPRVHIFGHIHEDPGAWFDTGTLMINATTCNFQYRPVNKPIMLHLPYEKTLPATIISY